MKIDLKADMPKELLREFLQLISTFNDKHREKVLIAMAVIGGLDEIKVNELETILDGLTPKLTRKTVVLPQNDGQVH